MGGQRDPIREWRERYARRWLSIDFEPLSDAPFNASVVPIFDDPRVVKVAFSPGLSFRDDELVKDGEDAFGLMISRSRNLEITHQGRDLELCQGDATLLHVCATGTVGSRQNFGFLSALVPGPELTARCADCAVMQRVPRGSEALQLLLGYLGTLERHRFHRSPETREIIRRHIFDLISLAITSYSPLGQSSMSAVVAARLAAILDYIAAHFHEPELSENEVARSQGISPRYVQRLLETLGTPFTQRVNELRLQEAFALLTGPGGRTLRILDVALAVGFSDLSHFNRLFRSRFGDTPSGVRGEGRGTQ